MKLLVSLMGILLMNIPLIATCPVGKNQILLKNVSNSSMEIGGTNITQFGERNRDLPKGKSQQVCLKKNEKRTIKVISFERKVLNKYEGRYTYDGKKEYELPLKYSNENQYYFLKEGASYPVTALEFGNK